MPTPNLSSGPIVTPLIASPLSVHFSKTHCTSAAFDAVIPGGRSGWLKFCGRCIVILLSLGVIAPARATFVTAYFYEMHVSGTFGPTIDPNISNLPDSTYPFPQMRGGSFDGTFVYDSMASLDNSFEGRFPYVSVNINLFDNTGALANMITTSPSNFYVTNNTLQLTFGPSFGVPNGIEDLRLFFDGNFTRNFPPPPPGLPDGWGDHNLWIVPPPPSELTAASLNVGFLETDGNQDFTIWNLPVTSASITQIGTTSYLREVPDAGSTISLLGLSLMGLFAARWRATRQQSNGRVALY